MTQLPGADFMHRLADAAELETMSRYRKPIKVDSKDKPGWRFDPVTAADREAERAMRALIAAEYPHHAILGEEFGASGEGPMCWVLDPVDGTRPFLCGIPVWGTIFGMTVEGRSEMGMLAQPFTGERFWATPEGAWGSRGGQQYPLRVREVDTLADAILHTTSPEPFTGDLAASFGRLTEAVRMTRYGGECYAFAMLAAGHIDLCVEIGLQPYDIVPIIPIVERAGGIVTRFDGSRAEGGGNVLVSATPRLHEAALRILKA
ncbi:inositol monophosphatase family protein [Neotabrizicola sp. VNH66]|uniref:inositol monophosphatase family protein n=1 Tax=Neotabrizicola sp. VNH66 TaxID=3400918 RepID=UPI003C0E3A3E